MYSNRTTITACSLLFHCSQVELFSELQQDVTYRFYAKPQMALSWLDERMRCLPNLQCDVESEGGCLCKPNGEEKGVGFAGCPPSGRCEARQSCAAATLATG